MEELLLVRKRTNSFVEGIHVDSSGVIARHFDRMSSMIVQMVRSPFSKKMVICFSRA